MTTLAAAGGFAAMNLSQQPANAAPAPGDLRTAAAEAWIYGLALIEMAQTRTNQFADGAKVGHFRHMRTLSGPETRWVTTPNNDTLYSMCWLDLSRGPATLTLPEVGDRYFAVAMMDMYSNNYTVMSPRTLGGGGGKFTIVGPDASTRDPLAIRSPTRWSWVTIRLLVDNEADLPAVHALQDKFVMQAPSAPAPKAPALRDADWPEYFASVQTLMTENTPPAMDMAALRRMSALGLGPTGGFDPKRFSAAERAEIAAGVADARGQVIGVRRRGPVAGGWSYPRANNGDFGQDYLMRAQVALGGLGTLTRVEAIYARPLSATGSNILDSETPRRISFAAGSLPPVDSFWSLSLYQAEPSGQFYFTENAIRRYAIGDRTPGLKYGADGSLDIWISRADPGGERTANWLPAPQNLPYGLVMRAYLPRAELVDGTYLLPPLQLA
jgi:hypothetical protein